jgi:hypothetical protein
MHAPAAPPQALVMLGNKFLCACIKEVRHLWAQLHFDTIHQFLIIVEAHVNWFFKEVLIKTR